MSKQFGCHNSVIILGHDQNGQHFADNIFKMHLVEIKSLYNDSNLNQASSLGTNRHKVSFGSGNGLVPVWHQAIIWTNDDQVHWHIYTSPSLSELTLFMCLTRCVWDSVEQKDCIDKIYNHVWVGRRAASLRYRFCGEALLNFHEWPFQPWFHWLKYGSHHLL